MKSKYIIRIDDACPTMDRERYGLSPRVWVSPSRTFDIKRMKN